MIRKLLVFIALNMMIITASANPEGGVVTSGDATITQTPGYTEINQTSGQAIIDWHSFNIGANEQTHFQQPAGGVALNRIDPMQGASQIFGQLTATGRIILINQAGIFFGPSAKVDVVGIIASTSDITNANFLAGQYRFDQPSSYNGAIINQGMIRAADYGLVSLVGTGVSNEGTITARLGNVVLASGDKFTVDMYGDQMINFSIDQGTTHQAVDQNRQPLSNAVNNSGNIIADGGRVVMSARAASSVLDHVINMKGIVQANSVSEKNGEIILDGGKNGIVSVSGKMYASGKSAGQRGGTVKVLGEKVGIMDAANIDVTGDQGGGEILIGGNAHGAGPEQNALVSYLSPDAILDASAITNGDGGKIVVWADDTTRAYGTILAHGGSQGGNGGFAETSGKVFLDVGNINVDLTAPHGLTGVWLLDPTNINIVVGGAPSTTFGSFNGANPNVFVPDNSGTPATVGRSLIQANLDTANVTINTASAGTDTGNISIEAAIIWTSGNTLSFIADGAITQTAGSTITNTMLAGGLAMSAADGITLNADINTIGTHTYSNDVTIGTNSNVKLTGTSIALSGALILNGNLTLENSASDTVFNVSGSGSLTKQGTGTITMSGANSYLGATTINNGTLALSGLGSIATSSGVSVASGAVFDISATNSGASIANLTGAGNVTLGGKGLTITNASGTYSGVISGAGAGSTLSINGGTQILTGTNSYAGITTIGSGATLQLGDNTTTGSIAGNVIDGGTLTFNRSTDFTFANQITSGAGGVTQAGSGAVTLTAVNSYLGMTTINDSATLKLSGSGSIATSSMVTDYGTFDIGNTTSGASIQNLVGSGNVTLGGKALTISMGVGTSYFYSGIISGAGAGSTLTLSGSNSTLFLSNASSYEGVTTIGSGVTLVLGNGGAAGSIGSGDIVNNGTLAFSRNADFTFSNTISSGTGGVRQAGTGAVTLTAANVYTGTTTIDSGTTLKLSGAGSIASSSSVADAGTFDISNTTSGASIVALTGAGGVTLGGMGLTITNASGVYSGVMSGAGAGSTLTINAGTQILTGANTYAGITTIANGAILQLGNNAATGSLGTGNVTNNGTLAFNSTGSLTVANAISGSGVLAQNGTGTTVISGNNLYTGGTNINAGALSLQSFTALGSPSGSSLVSVNTGGVLDLSNYPAIPFHYYDFTIPVNKELTLNGGELLNNNRNVVQLIGDGKVNLTQSSLINVGSSNTINSYVDIIGSGGLTKNGAGYLFLYGANTYAGTTTVNEGILSLASVNSGSGASFNSNNIIIGSAGQFEINATYDIDITFSNSISGSGKFVHDGWHTVTLTNNNNTFTGNVEVNNATLQLGNGGTTGGIGSGNIRLGNPSNLGTRGILAINRSNAITLANTITGDGDLTKFGTGTATLTSNGNAYTGTTTINDGILQAGNGGSTGSIGTGMITIAVDTAFAVNRNTDYTLSNNITGAGIFSQLGSGTTTLSSSNNNFTGIVSISGGVLKVGNASVFSSTPNAVNINSNGTFDLNGKSLALTNLYVGLNGGSIINSDTLNPVTGLSTGSGQIQLTQASYVGGAGNMTINMPITGNANIGLTKIGNGTLILSDDNTYGSAATTTINAGTLQLGNGGAFGSIASAIVNNGVLAVNRSNSLDISSVISGSGSFHQAGTGTTTLSGNNTYSGGTTVDAGKLTINSVASLGSPAGSTPLATINNPGTLNISGGATITLPNGKTIKFNGGSLTADANFPLSVIDGDGTITLLGSVSIGNDNAPMQIKSAIIGESDFTLTKAGNTVLTLSGGNSYKGPTIINGGNLNLGDGGTTGSLASSSIAINDNTGFLVNLSSDVEISSAISGPGQFFNIGTGKVTLTNNNTSFSGAININSGSLELGNGGATGGIGSGAINNAGSLIINRSNDITLANLINGTGNVVKNGGGMATLSNVLNNYLGTTAVNAGTLVIASYGALGITGGDITVAGGASLDLQNAVFSQAMTKNIVLQNNSQLQTSIGGSTYYGAITLNGTANVSVSGGAGLTLSGVISGSAGLTKIGAGNLVLATSNSYTGATQVNAGKLIVQSNNGLGTVASGTTVASGATLELANVNYAALESLTLNAGSSLRTNESAVGASTFAGNVALNAAEINTSNNTQLTLSGVISGSGGLTKAGNGTLVLSNANTYSGVTSVNAGTLNIDTNAGAFGSSQVTVESNALLGLLNTLSGPVSNAINLNGGTLNNDGDRTLSGAITLGSGSVSLISTSGVLTINNTINNAGELGLNGSGSFVLGQAVGGIVPLKRLYSQASLHINGGAITTTASQSYSGLVTLGQNTVLTTLGGNSQISLGGGLADSGTARTLTLVGANNDGFEFGGTVGANNTITVNGGSGTNNMLDFSSYSTPVYVTLAASNNGGVADVGNMTFNNINSLGGAGFTNTTLDAINVVNAKAYIIADFSTQGSPPILYGYISDPFYFYNVNVVNAKIIYPSPTPSPVNPNAALATLQNLNATLTAQTTSYLQFPQSAIWFDEQTLPTIMIKSPILKYNCKSMSNGGVCSDLFVQSAFDLQLSSNQ